MAGPIDPFANSVSARTQLLDRLSSGERVDPEVAGSIDAGALTDQGEFVKGLRRFGYSADATTRAFAGQMLEPIAPRFSKPLIDSAVNTIQQMPQSVRPEYETFEAARKDGLRGLGSFAASALGEGLPSTAVMLGAGLAGRGAAALMRAGPAARAAAQYGAGVTAMTPMEGGETALQIQQDPQALANTTPAERAALTLGRGGVNAALENIVPQALVAPRLMGQAARIGTGLGNAARNTALIAGEGALGEYGTEVAQDLTGQAALKLARGEQQGNYDWAQANEAGIKGAITGGVTGGIAGGAQALYSNIGAGTDAAKQRVAEANPADRFVSALRQMTENPQQFGADAANMTLDAIAKAASATSSAAKQAGPTAAKGLDTAVDAVGLLKRQLDSYIINNVSPENRDAYIEMTSRLGSMTAGEYKAFTSALRAETGKEFQENLGIAARSAFDATKRGVRKGWDWTTDVFKGASQAVSERTGAKQSLDTGGYNDSDRRQMIERVGDVAPRFVFYYNALNSKSQRDVANLLLAARDNPSYFEAVVGDNPAVNDPVRQRALQDWRNDTGTELTDVLKFVRQYYDNNLSPSDKLKLREQALGLADNRGTNTDRTFSAAELYDSPNRKKLSDELEGETSLNTGVARDELGNQLDEDSRVTNPWNREAFRESMYPVNFKNEEQIEDYGIPVEFSSDQLTPRQIAAIFGKRVEVNNDGKWSPTYADFSERELNSIPEDAASYRTMLNSKSLASVLGTEGNRERFAPFMPERPENASEDPLFSENRFATEKMLSALAALQSEGIQVDPETVGLPAGDPITIKANVDLNRLKNNLVVRGDKKKKNAYTIGDYTGATKRERGVAAQARLLESFKGNFSNANDTLFKMQATNQTAEAINREAYKRAARIYETNTGKTFKDLPKAQKTARINDQIALYAEEVTEKARKQAERRANSEYTRSTVDVLRTAYREGELTDADVDAIRASVNSDVVWLQPLLELLYSLDMPLPATYTEYDNKALLTRLEDMLLSEDASRDRSDAITTGRVAENPREEVAAAFKADMQTPEQRANTLRKATLRRAEERDPEGAAKGRQTAKLVRETQPTSSTMRDSAVLEAAMFEAINNAKTTIRLNEVGKRIAARAAELTEGQKQRLRKAFAEKTKELAKPVAEKATVVKAPSDLFADFAPQRTVQRAQEPRAIAREDQTPFVAERYVRSIKTGEKTRLTNLDEEQVNEVIQRYGSEKQSLDTGAKQSLDTGAKQNKASENKLVDDYIAAIAESKSGAGVLFEGTLEDTDEATTAAILNTLFDKERAKFLHDNLEDEDKGLTDGEEQEIIDAAKNYFEFLSKQGNLDFDSTSTKDLESTIGQAIDQAATVIRLEAIGKRIAARTGELSKEATERLREKYKAKKEALLNPKPKELTPPQPPNEVREKFIKAVEKLVGKRVRVMFDQKLADGVVGEYTSREDFLEKVRDRRRWALEELKVPFADREPIGKGPPSDRALQKVIDDANAKEQEILADKAMLGVIRIAAGMEQRAGLAEHESFHGAFSFFFNANNGEERRVLTTAFSSGIVNRRLREYFKDNDAILAKIDPNSKSFDPEEAAAYGFQVWMMDPSALQLGERVQNIFERVKKFFRDLFGMMTVEERAQLILNDLATGRRAERGTSPLAKQLDKDRPWTERAQIMAKDVGGLIKSGYDMLLSPVYDRLLDSENPAIAQIAKLGYQATGEDGKGGYIQNVRLEARRQQNRLNNIFKGLTDEQMKELHNAKIADVRPTDKVLAERFDALTQWYKDMYNYQVLAGTGIKNAGINENYYPLLWDAEKVLKDKDAFLKMLQKPEYADRMGELMMTPNEIWESITAYIERGEDLASVVGRNNEPISESSRKRTLGFITRDDRRPFMTDDLVHTSMRYMQQAVRQAEFVRAYGQNGETLRALRNEAQSRYGATNDQMALVDDYIDGLLGNKEVGMSRELKDLYGAMTVYQNYRLLPFSLFSSLVDPIGIAVRSNSIGDAWDTFSYSIKNVFNELKKDYTPDQWEVIAQDWGIIEASGTTINADALYTGVTLRGTTKKLNDAFFKYNLLNGWIRNNHIMAVRAAQQFMYRASEGFFKGKGQNERYLEELGVTKDDIIYDQNRGRILMRAEELEAAGKSKSEAAEIEERLRRGTEKFVRQALLNPSSAELANWASNPYLAPISHLKQFVWAFNSTIIKRLEHEAENQNFTPVLLAAAYVPGMIAADLVKDFISNAGEEPPYKKDWTVVDYVQHGIMRSGLTGTGQFFVDVQEDMARGGAGYESFAGPSLEQLQKGVEALSQGDTAKMERWFVKALPANAIYDQWTLPQ